jgi:hypothetical protein
MTAVQLLKHRIQQVTSFSQSELLKFLQEAESHEKTQIKIAYATGYIEGFNQLDCDEHITTSEQYYTKTYGK